MECLFEEVSVRVNVLLCVCVVMLSMSCAQSFPVGRAEARGDAYRAENNAELARIEYESALQDEPENRRLQEKLAQSRGDYLSQSREEIRASLDDGEHVFAMSRFRKLERTLSGEEYEAELGALREEIIKRTHSAARVAYDSNDYKTLYTLRKMMVSYFGTSAKVSQVDVGDAKALWVEQIKSKARADEGNALLASAALHWFKVYDLTGKEADLLRARDDYQRAMERQEYSVSVISAGSSEVRFELVLPLLSRHFEQDAHLSGKIDVLSEGSVSQGSTLEMSFRKLECDHRVEQRAVASVASKKPTVVQRCHTTATVRVLPSDGNRRERTEERFLVEELVHKPGVQLTEVELSGYAVEIKDRLYEQSAVLALDLIKDDYYQSREDIVKRAQSYPLKRAVLNAHVLLYWLDRSAYGSPENVDLISEQSGFDDVVKMLNAVQGR